jgi:hypothetical protein
MAGIRRTRRPSGGWRPSSGSDTMVDAVTIRQCVHRARRTLPPPARPFANNLIAQFRFYEKADSEHREGMKPLMAWQWEMLKRAAASEVKK